MNTHDLKFTATAEKGDVSAILQVWGENGDGPWVHVPNIASFLVDGLLDEAEIKETQL